MCCFSLLLMKSLSTPSHVEVSSAVVSQVMSLVRSFLSLSNSVGCICATGDPLRWFNLWEKNVLAVSQHLENLRSAEPRRRGGSRGSRQASPVDLSSRCPQVKREAALFHLRSFLGCARNEGVRRCQSSSEERFGDGDTRNAKGPQFR